VCEFNLPPNLYEYFVCVFLGSACVLSRGLFQPPAFPSTLATSLNKAQTASVSAFPCIFFYLLRGGKVWCTSVASSLSTRATTTAGTLANKFSIKIEKYIF